MKKYGAKNKTLIQLGHINTKRNLARIMLKPVLPDPLLPVHPTGMTKPILYVLFYVHVYCVYFRISESLGFYEKFKISRWILALPLTATNILFWVRKSGSSALSLQFLYCAANATKNETISTIIRRALKSLTIASKYAGFSNAFSHISRSTAAAITSLPTCANLSNLANN